MVAGRKVVRAVVNLPTNRMDVAELHLCVAELFKTTCTESGSVFAKRGALPGPEFRYTHIVVIFRGMGPGVLPHLAQSR